MMSLFSNTITSAGFTDTSMVMVLPSADSVLVSVRNDPRLRLRWSSSHEFVRVSSCHGKFSRSSPPWENRCLCQCVFNPVRCLENCCELFHRSRNGFANRRGHPRLHHHPNVLALARIAAPRRSRDASPQGLLPKSDKAMPSTHRVPPCAAWHGARPGLRQLYIGASTVWNPVLGYLFFRVIVSRVYGPTPDRLSRSVPQGSEEAIAAAGA